jgi:hypothetical protein
MYLYDDNNSLPDNFDSEFALKDVYMLPQEDDIHLLSEISCLLSSICYLNARLRNLQDDSWNSLRIFETSEDVQLQRKKNKSQFAQSKRFNTLPKRSNVDKFKHRYGAKTQKYR